MQMYLYVAKLWIMIEQNDVRNCENWLTVVSLSSGDGYNLNRMTAGHVIRLELALDLKAFPADREPLCARLCMIASDIKPVIKQFYRIYAVEAITFGGHA